MIVADRSTLEDRTGKKRARRLATDANREVKAISRIFAIIGCFTDASPVLSVAEISEQTGLAPSTVHRYLSDLAALNAVSVDGERSLYRLGLRMLEGSRVVLNSLAVRRASIDQLRQLAERTGANANLGVVSHDRVHYVFRAPSPRIQDLMVHEGRQAPLHASAMGKVILAHMRRQDVDTLLGRTRMPSFTPHTITSLGELHAELERIREVGIAGDSEEFMAGSHCRAAPIRDASGGVVAAISVSSTGIYNDAREIHAHTELLLETAVRISHQLGLGLFEPTVGG